MAALADLTIYRHSEEEIARLYVSLERRQLQNKVAGYMYQDRLAGREFDPSEFVDPDWILKQLERQRARCSGPCGLPLDLQERDRNRFGQLSVQRLNNGLPHVRGNCVLWCVFCNNAAR